MKIILRSRREKERKMPFETKWMKRRHTRQNTFQLIHKWGPIIPAEIHEMNMNLIDKLLAFNAIRKLKTNRVLYQDRLGF